MRKIIRTINKAINWLKQSELFLEIRNAKTGLLNSEDFHSANRKTGKDIIKD